MATAQPFRISSAIVSNKVVTIEVTTRSDSYYILQAKQTLASSSSFMLTNFMLGNGGFLEFAQSTSPTGSMFFQVEQIPTTATNSYQADGVPDGWKLQHGLNPLVRGEINQIAPGYDIPWSQVYSNQSLLAGLPLAYFPLPSTNVLVGTSNVTVQVNFTKPYTGYLTYQLSGTAIPASSGVTGDYIQPSGSVYVLNSNTASILIRLVSEPDVEINRSIVVAISAPSVANQTYKIATNSCVSTIQILQSSQGVFVGGMAFTNGLFAGAQSVKIALRPNTGSNTVALFDVTGNALFGNTFTVPLGINAGFQLSGAQLPFAVTNTPWARNLSVNLIFGFTQTLQGIYTTPVTMLVSNLTASGVLYAGSGTLTVSQSQ